MEVNNRHSPLIARDEVKKQVRNVGYLGYILNLRNILKKENNFIFAMGFKKSEFSCRFLGFSSGVHPVGVVLHFTSLQLQVVYGTLLYILLCLPQRTSYFSYYKRILLVYYNPQSSSILQYFPTTSARATTRLFDLSHEKDL